MLLTFSFCFFTFQCTRLSQSSARPPEYTSNFLRTRLILHLRYRYFTSPSGFIRALFRYRYATSNPPRCVALATPPLAPVADAYNANAPMIKTKILTGIGNTRYM